MQKQTSSTTIELAQTTRAPSVDRDELLDQVLELLLCWHTHVMHAEGPAGLHAFLCVTAPRYLSMITHLRARHREIAERIDILRRLLKNGDPTLLAVQYQTIVDDIAVHDELETELLMDAIENL